MLKYSLHLWLAHLTVVQEGTRSNQHNFFTKTIVIHILGQRLHTYCAA